VIRADRGDTIGPSTWRIAALGRRWLFLQDTDRENPR
jgi:hypothetical protein